LLVTAILIICIASNPELAPVVPVLDAFGLDVLLYLFAAQGFYPVSTDCWVKSLKA
jgi:hypothetical protein